VLPSVPLDLRSWDMEFDGIAVELGEYLHFSRYRGITLVSPELCTPATFSIGGLPTVPYGPRGGLPPGWQLQREVVEQKFRCSVRGGAFESNSVAAGREGHLGNGH